MLYKIEYIDIADRQIKVVENKNKILIEEQNIKEGNFLIFSDVNPLENQLIELKDMQIVMMSGIADTYMATLVF